MRKRLRDYPSADELAAMYAEPHNHLEFADHVVRVDVTSALAHNMIQAGQTVADLACGDATIAHRLQISHNVNLILGDIAPGYPITGPIEKSVLELAPGSVDLFICSETIEHVDNPDELLRMIRSVARRLLLTTPEAEDNDQNPEHIWGWDQADMAEMLMAAGWDIELGNLLDLRPAGFVYAYQMWGCS